MLASHHKFSSVGLQLLLLAFSIQGDFVPATPTTTSEMLFIRHGRSRVRHSNEKDHIRWGLQAFDNLTLDYDLMSYDNDTAVGGSGGGQLFGNEFWLNSDNNISIVVKQSSNVKKTNSDYMVTSAPETLTTVTPKEIKKHKKKMMADIRKNVDMGLQYLKQHKKINTNDKSPIEILNDQEAENIDETQLTPSEMQTNHKWHQSNMVALAKTNIDIGSIDDSVGNQFSMNVKNNPKSIEPQHESIDSIKLSQQQYSNKQEIHRKQKKGFYDKTKAKLKMATIPATGADGTFVKTVTAEPAVYHHRHSTLEEAQWIVNVEHEKDNEVDVSTAIGADEAVGPIQSASTSVTGIGLDKAAAAAAAAAASSNFEEINLDESLLEIDGNTPPPYDGLSTDNDMVFAVAAGSEMGTDETNKFLEGVVGGNNEDEIYDWDEISRNNRRNLMRGRDVVTKFLQIVETQHSLGSNCEAGTSLNLGEGVVDRYAQDRFRVEAEVAVNRANMLTRIFKMTSLSVQTSVNLLHASVLSMVEFDDDIFAAGNCFDWNQHPTQQGLFCPFAYRLPAPDQGAIIAKDLATEYHYLGNTSEWFFLARKNAEKVISRNDQYIKAFHLYSNKTEERIEEDTLAVRYEDGRWSKPYYDCGGGNIWMLTYTVPFFGYENGTYFFKGTSGIDIDLRRVDIDQCPQKITQGTMQPLNIFAGTDKCKQRTTMCQALKGLGFRRGSYKCVCRKGFYFPDTMSMQKFFNGSLLEEEYEKLMLGKNSTYNIVPEYECLPCAEGCDSCEDGSPCIAALNWPMRTSILVLACTVIGLLPPAAWFTFRYQQVKVVRAASPALLRVIALGAFFIYCTTILMYPNPNLYTCTARIWLREIGFSLTYGALMLKTWRISVIFRVRSAKAVKITDAALLKRLAIICGVIGTCLLVRTLVSPPDVVVGRTADDLKAFLCRTNWWDYSFTSMEVLFLAWGVRLCIMVRKAPSEFNESRFISMAIYNEFLLTCFLNVSMIFLQSPANPDLLYIIFFCHTQLTITLLLALIFGSKVYIVLRSGKSHQETIGMGPKTTGAKFNFRPQVRTFANISSATTSTAQIAGAITSETKLTDQEALEEIRKLSVQLQHIQEMAPPQGIAVITISTLLDGLKSTNANQLAATQLYQPHGPLPLLSLSNEIQKYSKNQNNNLNMCSSTAATVPAPSRAEKSINTSLTGSEFLEDLLSSHPNLICHKCLQRQQELKSTRMTTLSCQQLGSPQQEGSISFSNIQLECMCSQPDDLDRTPSSRSRQFPATKTMPPQRATRGRNKTNSKKNSTKSSKKSHQLKRTSSPSIDWRTDGQQFKSGTTSTVPPPSICDNCKNSNFFLICDKCKIQVNSNETQRSEIFQMTAPKQNHILAERTCPGESTSTSVSVSTVGGLFPENATNSSRSINEITLMMNKEVHSTEDIAFYTTSDESSDNDAASDRFKQGSSEIQLVMCQSTSALSTTGIRQLNTIVAAPLTSSSSAAIGGSDDSESNQHQQQQQQRHSDENISSNSVASENGIVGNNQRNKHSKRPDKLILDLNDRSKYTKEVSV